MISYDNIGFQLPVDTTESYTMITFLPTPDFAESAAMLDSKRLGNQRVEARMILRWLRNPRDYPGHQRAGYTVSGMF